MNLVCCTCGQSAGSLNPGRHVFQHTSKAANDCADKLERNQANNCAPPELVAALRSFATYVVANRSIAGAIADSVYPYVEAKQDPFVETPCETILVRWLVACRLYVQRPQKKEVVASALVEHCLRLLSTLAGCAGRIVITQTPNYDYDASEADLLCRIARIACSSEVRLNVVLLSQTWWGEFLSNSSQRLVQDMEQQLEDDSSAVHSFVQSQPDRFGDQLGAPAAQPRSQFDSLLLSDGADDMVTAAQGSDTVSNFDDFSRAFVFSDFKHDRASALTASGAALYMNIQHGCVKGLTISTVASQAASKAEQVGFATTSPVEIARTLIGGSIVDVYASKTHLVEVYKAMPPESILIGCAPILSGFKVLLCIPGNFDVAGLTASLQQRLPDDGGLNFNILVPSGASEGKSFRRRDIIAVNFLSAARMAIAGVASPIEAAASQQDLATLGTTKLIKGPVSEIQNESARLSVDSMRDNIKLKLKMTSEQQKKTLRLSETDSPTTSTKRVNETESSNGGSDVAFWDENALESIARMLVSTEEKNGIRDHFADHIEALQEFLSCKKKVKVNLLFSADVCDAHVSVLLGGEEKGIVLELLGNQLCSLTSFGLWRAGRTFRKLAVANGYCAQIEKLRCSLDTVIEIVATANGSLQADCCPCGGLAGDFLRALHVKKVAFTTLEVIFEHVQRFKNPTTRFCVQAPAGTLNKVVAKAFKSHKMFDRAVSQYCSTAPSDSEDQDDVFYHLKFLDRLYWTKHHCLQQSSVKEDKVRGKNCPFDDPLVRGTLIASSSAVASDQSSEDEWTDAEVSKQNIIDEATLPEDDDVEFLEVLGEGNYGVVRKGIWRHTYVACKSVKNSDKTVVFDEARVILALQKHHHDNVMTMKGLFEDSSTGVYWIVTDFCNEGSLKQFLKISDKDPVEIVSQWAEQIAAGMEHISKSGYAHRDLRADNILIKDQILKIGDFGLSSPATFDSPCEVIGERPVAWYPPEALSMRLFYLNKSDVWSFGVVLWEMFSKGNNPWNEYSESLGLKWPAGVLDAVCAGKLLERPSACPPEFWDEIVLPCWEQRHCDRPTFTQLHARLEKPAAKLIDNHAEANSDDGLYEES